MITGTTKYPFVPRSRAKLVVGQFWSLPLPGGRFACGRLLSLPGKVGTKQARLLVVGIENWLGMAAPTLKDIRGKDIVARGIVHVSAIRENRGVVLGRRSLASDGIVQSVGGLPSLPEWSSGNLRKVAGKALRGLR